MGKKDNRAGTRFVPNNQITLLQNGETYFPVMEAALDRAEHEIYLISYIFKNDTIGRRIAEALRRAALRGVRTRVLIDGFGSSGYLLFAWIEFSPCAFGCSRARCSGDFAVAGNG